MPLPFHGTRIPLARKLRNYCAAPAALVTSVLPPSSMNDDSETDPHIVLASVGEDDRCARRNAGNDLIAAPDDVPVDLSDSRIDAIVDFDVEPSAERKREARFIDGEVVDAEHGGQLRTVEIDLLHGETSEHVSKRLEGRSVFPVVFELRAEEKVLHRRVDCSRTEWAAEIVLAKVQRIVELRANVFVEVVIDGDIEALEHFLFAQHFVYFGIVGVSGGIVEIHQRVPAKELELLVIVLSDSRGDADQKNT